jgi:hypothetical protein
MERHIMWSAWDKPGLEHLHLVQDNESVFANGLVIAVAEQMPFRVHYELRCDGQWRVRELRLSMLDNPTRTIHLLTDGQGSWTDETGVAVPSLKGCLDVDISATPFTNTLPIRRLALEPGTSATLSVVYIDLPRTHIKAAEQRYTCLASTSSGGRYRFESLENGVSVFTAELPVDLDGLVLDYPGLFRRVGAW